MTVLAGDIGGTNTRLAIYDVLAPGAPGAEPLFEHIYPSAAHTSLDVIAEMFLRTATAKIGPLIRGFRVPWSRVSRPGASRGLRRVADRFRDGPKQGRHPL